MTEAYVKELLTSPDPMLRALGTVVSELGSLTSKFTKLEVSVQHVQRQIEATSQTIENGNRKLEQRDSELDRSIDRVAGELAAIARAQGVQATMVQSLCHHLGIRESTIHDASAIARAGE